MRRPRFGLRWLMFFVALFSLLFGAERLYRRRSAYLEKVELFTEGEKLFLRDAAREHELLLKYKVDVAKWKVRAETAPTARLREICLDAMRGSLRAAEQQSKIEGFSRLHASRGAELKRRYARLARYPWLSASGVDSLPASDSKPTER